MDDSAKKRGDDKVVAVGPHRLTATVFGVGSPVVVIEPGYGGAAAAWRDFAAELAADTTVVTYDRAPYGSSSAAVDGRTPREVAADLRGLLAGLGLAGPFVLVGHSSGGRIVRQFAAQHPDLVAGMVLVDSSHEDQQHRLAGSLPWRMRLGEALEAPRLLLGWRNPMSLARRRSQAREFRALARQTAADIPLAPGALGDKPLVVLTRAAGSPPDPMWQGWHELQTEFAKLSADSRHLIADSDDHFLHLSRPALVLEAVRSIVYTVRDRSA